MKKPTILPFNYHYVQHGHGKYFKEATSDLHNENNKRKNTMCLFPGINKAREKKKKKPSPHSMLHETIISEPGSPIRGRKLHYTKLT